MKIDYYANFDYIRDNPGTQSTIISVVVGCVPGKAGKTKMQSTGKQKKVKRINVYLSHADRKILNEIRDKYHLSYSTIANIIFEKTLIGYPKRILMVKDHYYYEDDQSTKTSIKPRNAGNETYFATSDHPLTMMFTNLIKIFTRREYNKILGIEKNEEQKLISKIYNEFQNTYDPNWDGNSFTRRAIKVFKQNKDYIKRISGQEDI